MQQRISCRYDMVQALNKQCPIAPWATLEIAPEDAITDSEEALGLLRAHGIENVIVMGVHTNMCVLGRPFAIRNLLRLCFCKSDEILDEAIARLAQLRSDLT